MIATPNDLRDALARLTERETDVLRLIAIGKSNPEIVDDLYIGMHTLKKHLSSIYVKIGARDRAQAVVIAYQTGLVRPLICRCGAREPGAPDSRSASPRRAGRSLR